MKQRQKSADSGSSPPKVKIKTKNNEELLASAKKGREVQKEVTSQLKRGSPETEEYCTICGYVGCRAPDRVMATRIKGRR